MPYPADVKAAIPAILTDAGPAPEKGPGAPVNAVYVKYGVAPSCAETNPVHPPQPQSGSTSWTRATRFSESQTQRAMRSSRIE
jgi:hypothetical protein